MHWRNSNFQIRHFIVGKCHSADEAWRVLQELREDRAIALASSQRFSFGRAWRAFLLRTGLVQPDAIDRQAQACIDAGVRELEYIDLLMRKIEPHRKYRHLPDHQAHQAAQRDEWREKLKARAENMLMSQNVIPWDHLETMRAHPDWREDIGQHVLSITKNDGRVLIEQPAPEWLLALPAPTDE